MEPVRDPFVQYTELLNKAFDKIRKQCSTKRHKELKDICTDSLEKIKNEKEGPYDANQYFYILKMGLELKISKLTESILYIIQPPTTNGRHKRKLIDAVVESICSCVSDRDNQVQLQVIKVLLTIVNTFMCKVHEKTLLEIIRACFHIHISSSNSVNQNTAKASLTQMIHIIFQRMEAYSGNVGIEISKVKEKIPSILNTNLGAGGDASPMTPQLTPENILANLPQNEEEKKAEELGGSSSQRDASQQLSTGQNSQRQATPAAAEQKESSSSVGVKDTDQINYSALDQYIFTLVQNMVDDVEIYSEKCEPINQTYEQMIQSLDDQEEKDLLEQKWKQEIDNVPLRCVPYNIINKDDSKYKKNYPIDVTNEKGFKAGKFGWCIVCRSKADLYCRDTRHPVCSYECKHKHINLIDSIQAPLVEGLPQLYNTEEGRAYFTDGLIIFKSICKLCLKDVPSNMNSFQLKSKILGLELILAVVDNPGPGISKRKEFVDVIKETLCDGLLKHSVCSEKSIFALSLSIFYGLFVHFRSNLKAEIAVFIEQIFLKILDSGNSNYHHKFLILKVFENMAQNTKHLLEIFVNFDCDVDGMNIFERMIDILSKIAQGKFSKQEHQVIINQTEEMSLKMYALQILVQIVKNVNTFSEIEANEAKVAVRESNASLKEGVESDEDESTPSNSSIIGTDRDSTFSQQKTGIDDSKKQDMYERNRLVKTEMNKAAIKFNLKPKNGINYLISIGYVSKEQDQKVQDIVNFLKMTAGLDKTMIGDYLGDDTDLTKQVMYEYCDSYDFVGKTFLGSLKILLSGFRLPGEGQKVDRIMEKFGEKFTRDNPQAFANADCAYVLAYAVIMCQTSIHNPQANKKNYMKRDDFMSMTRGINDGQDLDPEFVGMLYDTIEAEPITLAEDDEARLKAESALATSFRKKQEVYSKEAQGYAKRGAELIKKYKGSATDQFISVNDSDAVRPLFEMCWSAMLAVFSVLLEESEDQKVYHQCIDGFMQSIKITGYYNMETERNAFVSSLSKFTSLNTMREIKDKNIDCVKALLNLAKFDGNILRNAWYYVLDCISKIDHMIVLGTGTKRDSQSHYSKTHKNVKDQIILNNCEAIVQNIDQGNIDLIFQRSQNLNNDAITDFIESLCKVSKEELEDKENPRVFSLQRIVEVADFNMGRIRFVWTNIWRTLSEHFIYVGRHPNKNIAEYSIDSLRQLAYKFLLKEEFGSYNFQRDFLKPFETIMLENLHTRFEIKEYIVACISNMCQSMTKNIKSGWSIILNIFTLAAQDSEEYLLKQSYASIDNVIKNHFHLIEDSYVELMNCLIKFCKNQFLEFSLKALDLVPQVASQLHQSAELKQKLLKAQSKRQEEQKVAGDDQVFPVQQQIWQPILQGISQIVLDKRPEVQKKALLALFSVLQRFSGDFSPQFWQFVFKDIYKNLINDIIIQVEKNSKNVKEVQFYGDTAENIFMGIIEQIEENNKQLDIFNVLFLELQKGLISQVTEKTLAQVGMKTLKQFILNLGQSGFGKEQWDETINELSEIFKLTTPRALLQQKDITYEDLTEPNQSQSNVPLPFNQDACFTMCITQLSLINTVTEVVDSNYDNLSYDNIKVFLEALQNSFQFAQEFNQEVLLRYKLWKDGFMSDLKQLPGLIKQEREGLTEYLTILFKLYHDPKEGMNQKEVTLQLFEQVNISQYNRMCKKILKDYAVKQTELNTLNNSKSEEAKNPNVGVSSSRSGGSVESKGDSEPNISYLHENEIERELVNLTPIVANTILPGILKLNELDVSIPASLLLNDSQLKSNLKSFTPILIDLTICNNFEIRKTLKDLLHIIFGHVLQRYEDE